MSYLNLFLTYASVSILFKWLLSWGGAEKIEGWQAGMLIGWTAQDWTAEQIRFYALLAWIAWSVLCFIGLLLLIFDRQPENAAAGFSGCLFPVTEAA